MTTSTTWTPPSELAEQCLDLYGLTCPPLWGPPRRPEFPSLGPKLWRVMDRMGFPPMPWQKYVSDVSLEIDPATGYFAYREVGLSIPRQEGKTQLLQGVQVHRAAAWPRQNIVYAAQTRGMARQRFEDEFIPTLDASSLAGRYRIRMSNGNEAIIWSKTRSKIGITSNTEKAGHGPPLDLGQIDEAFAHEDDRLEQAFSPAMLTRLMAQLWWASAGGTEKSIWLNKKRAAGRELIERLWAEGIFPRAAYFEWFAPDELPRDDPATWETCLPALCPAGPPCRCDPDGRWHHTVFPATVEAELEKLDAAEFDRAYLNRTRRQVPPQDPNIPVKAWPGIADPESQPGEQVAFAIEVSQDRSTSTIGLVSPRADGRVHLEVVDRRPGTDWVVPAIVRLRALWKPVGVAIASTGSPSGSLIDDLVAAGVTVPKEKDKPKRGDLAIARTHDFVEACGQMADAINQGVAVHRDQAVLTAAVNGARTRPLGDAWALDRLRSLTDVTPFYAVTLARWLFEQWADLVKEEYDPLANIF